MSQMHYDYPGYNLHTDYSVSYHGAGPGPSVFAGGSSLDANHLEHPQWSASYLHDRRGVASTAQHRYHGDSATSTSYATTLPISAYRATGPSSSAAGGRAWLPDIGVQGGASLDEVQGPSNAVHGHDPSEALSAYSARSSLTAISTSPVMSSSSRSSGSGSRGGGASFKSPVVLASPIPQVPTPASMAILLNNSGDEQQPPPRRNLVMVPADAIMYPDMSQHSVPLAELDQDDVEEGFLSREKKHGCTMCHKRFDRPSTLKKHLLVHTGEKAFQCHICERRFGVMSNLNRHIRRCSLREVHTHGSAAALPTPERSTGKRATSTTSNPAPPRKRRRRPPSPSRWVPASLRSLNLLTPETNVPCPCPLNPVSPGRSRVMRNYDSDVSSDELPYDEERDSWDENVALTPYVAGEWEKKRRLPGPCAMTKFGGALAGNYGSSEGDYAYGAGAGVRPRAIRV